jgi:hypothetical protein
MAVARPKPAIPGAARHPFGVECDLFDGNGEPSDQPCDLVQLAGIMILKRPSQASQTFVVAHRGRFARHDRRHRPFEVGLELRHQITLKRIRHPRKSAANKSFWRQLAAGLAALSCGNQRTAIFVP